MTICGLDECGRGALAGPLVAAGVILKKEIIGLKDSKKLTAIQRRRLYKKILETAQRVEVEIISARKINNQGVGWANKEVFRKLIMKIEASKYIVDGNLNIKVRGKTKRIRSLIKADSKVGEVMAASIVAKVTRDNLMRELHNKHPHYGWQTNVGYGTAYHLASIGSHGMVHYHRSVFVTTALRSQTLDSS